MFHRGLNKTLRQQLLRPRDSSSSRTSRRVGPRPLPRPPPCMRGNDWPIGCRGAAPGACELFSSGRLKSSPGANLSSEINGAASAYPRLAWPRDSRAFCYSGATVPGGSLQQVALTLEWVCWMQTSLGCGRYIRAALGRFLHEWGRRELSPPSSAETNQS